MKPLTTFLVFALIVAVGVAILFRVLTEGETSEPTVTPPAATAVSGQGAKETPLPPTQTPGPNDIIISIANSNTKQDWINAVIKLFNQERHQIAGKPIFVEASHVTSRKK